MNEDQRLNASTAMKNTWVNVTPCYICGKRELGDKWRYRNHKVYCNKHWSELNKGASNGD